MAVSASDSVRVLISGIGPVTCLGLGMDEVEEGISEAGVVRETGPEGVWGRVGAGLIRDFDLTRFVLTQRPYLDAQSRAALAAAAIALDSAGVERDEVNPLRRGLAFATMLGNLETQALFQKLVDEKGMRLASPVLFSHSYANSTSSILSIEFSLRGHNQNFCGDLLCGAQALESALLALRSGRADLVIAGGADVVGPAFLGRLGREGMPGSPPPAQAAALLVLETQDGLEKREGYAFCELCSVACCGTPGPPSADGVVEALRRAMRQAMEEAQVWGGDIGIVFVSSGVAFSAGAPDAEKRALDGFSQVPVTTAKRFAGETFAAGFPLECILAADLLNDGFVPPRITFEGKHGGIEFWVERQPEPMMGDCALVVGCTPDLAAAAVLKAL
jgi:3-oxoacyl-[acyl-carrier-protein] synthase II